MYMKQGQLSDKQNNFIHYLVHQGKGRTEAARLAGLCKSKTKRLQHDTITKNHSQNPPRAE